MDSIFNPYQPIGAVSSTDEIDFSNTDSSNLAGEYTPAQPILLIAFIILISFLLIGRLFHLQIVKGASNFFLAEGNRIRQLPLPAPRGIIYDQTNKPLVENTARYSLVVIPSDLPKRKDARQTLFDQIALKFSDEERAVLSKAFFDQVQSIEPMEIISHISNEDAVYWQIELQDKSGLVILKQPERHYIPMPSIGHILGYLGKIDEETLKRNSDYTLQDTIGKSGLEATYESTLRGVSGAQQFEVDAKGTLVRTLANIRPRQGTNLKLSLHLGLQELTQQSLINGQNSPKAVAIAVNPRSGNILAMVSLPDFDPNVLIAGNKSKLETIFNDDRQPLVNRAIAGGYPSGSTIKPMFALAALQEKIISPSFSVDTPSEITIGEFHFPDWKDHGVTDVRRAIAESNNIFFYAVAGGWGQIKGLGIERLVKYLHLYNFGEKTGIDLPGESSGFVPSPVWKQKKRNERWYIGDTYHLGIGQGDISVTPIQLLMAESAVFSNGKIMQPHLVESLLDSSGRTVEVVEPEVIRELPIDKRWLEVVKQGMRMTITEGSARSLNDLKDKNGQSIEVAGKTGTAQFGNEGKTHAWFVGFAPWNDPEIGVIVLIEGGGEGHAVAAPVAKKMFEYWFNRER